MTSASLRTFWLSASILVASGIVAIATMSRGSSASQALAIAATAPSSSQVVAANLASTMSSVPDWLKVLLITAAGGILGGTLGSMEPIDARAMILNGKLRIGWGRCGNVVISLLVGSLGGIGGAMAALFVAAIDKKVTVPAPPLDLIRLFTMGTIAGFIGLRLLRVVAERFQKTMETAKAAAEITATEVASKKVGEVATELRQDIVDLSLKNSHFAAAMSLAANALGHDEKNQQLNSLRRDALEQLEQVRPNFADRRTIGIFTGRLYRQLGQLGKAVDVLSEVLSARRQKGLKQDEDDAALLWNRACYRNMIAQNAAPDEAERLRQQGWADLQEAVRLHPPYAADLKDPDLDGLEKTGTREFSSLRAALTEDKNKGSPTGDPSQKE